MVSVTFASNSIDTFEVDEIEKESVLDIETSTDPEDDSCRVYCYGTLENTETGDTYYFTANATAADCLTAQINCYSDVWGQMNKIMHAPD